MRYYLLTFLIVLGILSTFICIKIPFPEKYTHLDVLFDGKYRIFDLKAHLSKYENLKINIQEDKQKFAKSYQTLQGEEQKKLLSATKSYIFNTITDKIIPFWLKTEWDFNGTTESPRGGTIACGYFVSTILLHAGINLDKYYLSREASAVMIDKLCEKSSIQTIWKNDFEKFYTYMASQNDGLFIVGLEKHVGLLQKKGDEILFIHSRKPKNVGVICEKAISSTTLKKSKIYVVGNLLENEEILKNWLGEGTQIKKI